MVSAQGQDVIRCQLCSNPVEHHCNLCHVDLCLSCIPKHMADKSRKHEVVEYTSKKESLILPSCLTHEKNRCETYCEDCKVPVCVQCLIGSHKKHECTDINNILQEHKKQIIADTKELENTIVTKYKKVDPITSTAEFDKVLSAIEKQDDQICKAVHEASIQLKDKVNEQKKEAARKCKESMTLTDKAEKELKQIIQNNKNILEGIDALAIINYQSKNSNYRKGPTLQKVSCPQLLPGFINQDQIIEMIGFLKTSNDPPIKQLKMMDDPKVLRTIQSPYGDGSWLWKVQCVGKDKILTSGNDKTIREIDRTGSIVKIIHTNENVLALTINLQEEPVFTLSNFHHKYADIFRYKKDKVKVLLSTADWFPVGLCYTLNGDLLVSMRSMDETQSRVVRYTNQGKMKESQKIQFDSMKQPLFSTDAINTLVMTENGNGDICVADFARKTVVVVNFSGRLKFKYTGNLSKQSKYTEFAPLQITTDVNTQILKDDSSNNMIHITDCDGKFVRYIEHGCAGGLSIDVDHNLLTGNRDTGIIKIIKYLE